MERRRQDFEDYCNLLQHGLRDLPGRALEEVVCGTLRYVLGLEDVDPRNLVLRHQVVDVHGRVGPPGRTYQVSIIGLEGETWIFGVRLDVEAEDVEHFNDKAELAIATLGLSAARKLLITMSRTPEVQAACEARGIVLG